MTLVILDGPNLNGALNFFPIDSRFNFSKFKKIYANDGENPMLIYVTNQVLEEDNSFRIMLESNGFVVKCPPDENMYKNWDDEQIKQTINEYISREQIDSIVLVSGDGGYIPVLEKAQEKGIKTTIVGHRNTTHEVYKKNELFNVVYIEDDPGLIISPDLFEEIKFKIAINVFSSRSPWEDFIGLISREISDKFVKFGNFSLDVETAEFSEHKKRGAIIFIKAKIIKINLCYFLELINIIIGKAIKNEACKQIVLKDFSIIVL